MRPIRDRSGSGSTDLTLGCDQSMSEAEATEFINQSLLADAELESVERGQQGREVGPQSWETSRGRDAQVGDPVNITGRAPPRGPFDEPTVEETARQHQGQEFISEDDLLDEQLGGFLAARDFSPSEIAKAISLAQQGRTRDRAGRARDRARDQGPEQFKGMPEGFTGRPGAKLAGDRAPSSAAVASFQSRFPEASRLAPSCVGGPMKSFW
jgi:hypothetical protein